MEISSLGDGIIWYLDRVLPFISPFTLAMMIVMRRLKYSWAWCVFTVIFPMPLFWFVALEIWPLEKKMIGIGNLRQRVAARKDG